MLNELAKKDKYWRQTAYYICKDRCLADDLTQEMYLKLASIDKQINDFFVIVTIRNLFYDHCKKKKHEINTLDISTINLFNEEIEFDDEQKVKLDIIDKHSDWWEKELLEMSTDFSLRELEKRYNINYGFIFRTIKNIKEKVWEEVEKNKVEV